MESASVGANCPLLYACTHVNSTHQSSPLLVAHTPSVTHLGLFTQLTSINVDDIQSTFQTLGIVKYWNGQHILCVSKELLEEKFKKLVRQLDKLPHELQPEIDGALEAI